jgi:superfamily II RNA helicase
MPARTVCFQELRKYDGKGVVPLTVRQFMQKAGRAGRRGIDHLGYVVIREDFGEFDRDRDAIHSYLKGGYEQVRSAFNLSFNSVVNLLERHERDVSEIRRVIDKSFLNFHYLQQVRREQQRLDDIAASLAKDGWDPRLPEAGPPPRHLAGRAKKLRKMQSAARRDEDRVFTDFMDKVTLLQQVEYLDAELGFNSGARVLRHLQIEEIFSTELVLSGALDQSEPALVFGAFCSLSNSFSRSVVVRERLRGPAAQLARQMRQIRYGDAVRVCEQASGVPVTFTPEMIPFGIAWHNGASLQELMLMIDSPTDVSGDLVSAFRRAKDLAMQMRKVYGEDPYMDEKLRGIAKTVSRDEVEVVD